ETFLRTRHSVVLATLLANGQPDAAIVDARIDDGALSLSVDDTIRQRLAADDRVCAAAELCPSYYEIQGVSVHGDATPADANRLRVPLDDVISFDFGKIGERPVGAMSISARRTSTSSDAGRSRG